MNRVRRDAVFEGLYPVVRRRAAAQLSSASGFGERTAPVGRWVGPIRHANVEDPVS
jgi:hypothetical protein